METFTATSDQQPASFSGGKGKGAGVICQVEKEGFWEWGKLVEYLPETSIVSKVKEL